MNGPSTAPVDALRWRPLKALLGGGIEVPEALEVSDLVLDSREVVPGAAFLAVCGARQHGLQFAAEAVGRGARVVLWEPAPGVTAPAMGEGVSVIAVPQLGAQLGFIADRFFGAPSAALRVAGITGTNGKTTCAWLLAQALRQLGHDCAYAGTLGAGRPGALVDLPNTTPDAVRLQRLLAQWRADGVDTVALEVSSIALQQQRCAGLRFHTAVFTNLTRDHLDYHPDMAAYAAAKARLFDCATLAVRVFNIDDAFGADLARRSYGGRVIATTQQPTEMLFAGGDYVCATDVRADNHGLDIDVATSQGAAALHSPLVGAFNVDNLLSVLGVLLAWGVPLAQACAALSRCGAAPGRMQVSGGDGVPLAIIDYAHTPDALAQALRAARAHCRGRLWCVFGCGGERDAGKRALMGAAAAAAADEIVITDDNPRSEAPAAITAAILAGTAGHRHTRVIHDRGAAIGAALEQAHAADVVLVAGKGHERWQYVGTQRLEFDDAAVVRAALAARRGTSGAGGGAMPAGGRA